MFASTAFHAYMHSFYMNCSFCFCEFSSFEAPEFDEWCDFMVFFLFSTRPFACKCILIGTSTNKKKRNGDDISSKMVFIRCICVFMHCYAKYLKEKTLLHATVRSQKKMCWKTENSQIRNLVLYTPINITFSTVVLSKKMELCRRFAFLVPFVVEVLEFET